MVLFIIPQTDEYSGMQYVPGIIESDSEMLQEQVKVLFRERWCHQP